VEGITVSLTEGDAIQSRALVVASGMSDELPDVPGLAERWGTSALHCPYCHGWEFRDRRLGVLTTSPMGLHQAELVRQWSEDVVVFTAGAGQLTVEQERRLRSRGVRLNASPIVEVLGEGDRVTAVCTAAGEVVPLDAIYTVGVPRPHDGFLSGLGLARDESPFGSFLAVDAMGKTSSDRIWAVGNVVNPAANVAVSMGAGATAAGAVNMALITAEFDAASAAVEPWPEIAPADYWDRRYADATRVWSGRVNAALADVAAGLGPGTALDLGCGEGADAIWLAEHGWTATGIDISPTAIERAREAAHSAGISENRARFLAADLASLDEDARYDLVTASFLHSPVELARGQILRAAADRVAPGGHLLITSHAGVPPWAQHAAHVHAHHFLTPGEEIEQLDLDAQAWEIVVAEPRTRPATGPDGSAVTLDDAVVLLRRR
jgi:Thioredoxin reductase